MDGWVRVRGLGSRLISSIFDIFKCFLCGNKCWLNTLEKKWMWDCVLNFKEEPRLKWKHVIKKYLHLFPQVEFINHSYCQVCGGEAKHLVEIPLTFRDTQVFIWCSFSFQMAEHSPRDGTFWNIWAVKRICATLAFHMQIFEPASF